MIDNNYFSHDFGARNDPKLVALQMSMGGAGLGLWWCLVEMLYEQGGYLPRNYTQLAYTIPWASPEDIRRVVEEFGLFGMDQERFWNDSALARIGRRTATSEARRAAGRASGQARRANAEQMFNKCSTSAEQEINKEIKKEINNNNIIKCLEIIYFDLDAASPREELDRFLKHYEENGWTYSDGTPIDDPAKAASRWKPAARAGRDREFLRWYRGVYQFAVEAGEVTALDLLEGVFMVVRNGKDLSITFRDRDTAAAAYRAAHVNGLDKEWNISWKVKN